MLERAQHFEIFSRRDGRWTLEATRVRLDESVALATELLARGPYEAVRIVRARSVEGRTLVETVVYQAERTDEREPPIRLAAADDVIDNDGALAGLAPQIERLHHRYLELSRGVS